MVTDNVKTTKRLPPYISYKTWNKLLAGLVNFLPGVIDNSILLQLNFSGTDTKRLRTALRFLNLIDDNGVPLEDLQSLIKAMKGDAGDKAQILKNLLINSYPFLSEPAGGFSISNASWKQLTDRFDQMGTSGAVQALAINFFLQMAIESGMEISPHLSKSKTKSGYGRPNITKKAKQKKEIIPIVDNPIPQPIIQSQQTNIPPTMDIDVSVLGILNLLPHKGQKWDKLSKDRFKIALSAVLDAVYPDDKTSN